MNYNDYLDMMLESVIVSNEEAMEAYKLFGENPKIWD